jgi:transcriptional regulator with XRE-family HTH domain
MRLVRSRLGQLRQSAGFHRLADAAKRLGYSAVHLGDIERGKLNAGPSLVAKMAKLYQVNEATIQAMSKQAQLELMKRKRIQLEATHGT